MSHSNNLISLICNTCQTRFDSSGPIQDYCPDCGPRFGTLECLIDMDRAAFDLKQHPLSSRTEPSILRYDALLPFHSTDLFPALRIGRTPLYNRPALARQTGVAELLIKDDGQNPSGSYKDRASAIVTTRARELGYPVVACASTGNAAASLSACCAASGLKCIVFVPAAAPPAKLTQIAAYGATLIAVNGPYDQAVDLAMAACKRFGWLNRTAGMSPYLVEGKKTGALELCEDLDMHPPDAVFVSVGDGSVISGICKGFHEFHQLGLIPFVPRVIGVQATGSSVLCDAFETFRSTGKITIVPRPVNTIADSISVSDPREGVRAIRMVASTHGSFVAVPDEEIQHAIRDLARIGAVFAEPAGATAFAGVTIARATGLVTETDRVAVMITGNGLKDIKGVQASIDFRTIRVEPDMSSIDRLESLMEE